MVAKWRLSPIIQSPIFFFTRHGDQNGRSLERCCTLGRFVRRICILRLKVFSNGLDLVEEFSVEEKLLEIPLLLQLRSFGLSAEFLRFGERFAGFGVTRRRG